MRYIHCDLFRSRTEFDASFLLVSLGLFILYSRCYRLHWRVNKIFSQLLFLTKMYSLRPSTLARRLPKRREQHENPVARKRHRLIDSSDEAPETKSLKVRS